ncbi:glycerophosphodiester phosphodiesterase family protein [Mobilicoccus pelagius]|uniref:Putative glycerophosphoryl diester phosphodiesterase n=1 Tax=Mobilicoccus pelagius NBRC 104925 TaxID=1089455 RepID=H5UP95_9MICO|nr:glycerophosphodiester phosphodiesterase family protein [Mobilicoccus pelagius]GAB47553.1 putative glycerophosphoryl diester phosphodiesterase [Mobilicoccus pelagius NBRC 104925]
MAYADATGPIALAHRGGGGSAPENTLAAFALSTGLGFRYLESDLRLTADGRLVCFHDATLDRVTDARGPVAARTLEELRRIRVEGRETIPTLEEALEAFPDTYFSVDLKDARAIGPLVDVLRRPGVADRLCIAGAWGGWLREVRREVPAVATTLGWRSLTTLVACARAGVRPPWDIATAPFAHVPVRLGRVRVHVERVLEMAHGLGVRVVTWTVDDAPTMHRLLDVGVDAVITDRPDVLRAVFVGRDLWEPMSTPADALAPTCMSPGVAPAAPR